MTDPAPESTPAPPYPVRLPRRFERLPFDELPLPCQRRVTYALALRAESPEADPPTP